MRRRYFIIFSLAFFFVLNGQVPSKKDSSFRYRVNVNGALILNNAFSWIKRHPQPVDEFTTVTWTAPVKGKKTRTGFSFGADLLLFPKEHLKGVVGLAFSRSSAAHHYTYISEGKTSRTGFTDVRTVTNQDFEEMYSIIDLQAGIRNQVFRKLFITSSFVLSSPVRIKRTINGTTETFYSNNSGGSENFTTYTVNEQRTIKRTDQNLSLRFALEYQFAAGNSLARVFLSRNLGIVYTMPWWSMGISYTILDKP